MRILGIVGSVTEPSRTEVVVRAIAERVSRQVHAEHEAGHEVIRLIDAAPVIFRALRSDRLDAEGRAIIDAVEDADVLVVGSPVYRASYTGALKHLFDLVDYRALAGKRVILCATGGTALHGLMIDHQLRPLFAFFNALTLPTGIYATPADFDGHVLSNPVVTERIDRAVADLVGTLPTARLVRRAVPASRFSTTA